MSPRVSLSKHTDQTTQEEDTPVGIRRQRSRATVKDLHHRLQHASQRAEGRLVRRTTVLLALLVHHMPVEVLSARWGLSPSCLSRWRPDCLLHGTHSLGSRHGGGRPTTLTPQQRKRLAELSDAGPQGVGFETACWDAVLIRVLIWREFGGLSKRHDVWTLLHNVGWAVQKARGVSAHLDVARRQAWLTAAWPQMLHTATRRQGLIRCEDEASFAQWGSLSSTWARRGPQPEGTTSGKRTGSKVFGAMAYGAGRLCYAGIEGRVTSESSHAFLQTIMAHTTEPLCLIHDGARSPTSQATQQCLQGHGARLTAHPLPSSAPDDTPMAYVWRKTKKRATHHKYCKEFAALTVSVDKALAYFATHPDTV